MIFFYLKMRIFRIFVVPLHSDISDSSQEIWIVAKQRGVDFCVHGDGYEKPRFPVENGETFQGTILSKVPFFMIRGLKASEDDGIRFVYD